MPCECHVPGRGLNPRHRDQSCVKCGYMLDPRWVSSDATLTDFFRRLRESIPVVPPDFDAFEALCVTREREGRDVFGYAYLGRDNLSEAYEEAADGLNYVAFDVLKHLRDTGTEEDMGTVLTAAFHFFSAYAALRELQAKRRHAP